MNNQQYSNPDSDESVKPPPFRMPSPEELSKYVNEDLVRQSEVLRKESMNAYVTVLTRVAETILGRPIDKSTDEGRFRLVTSPSMMASGEEQLMFDGKLVGSIRQHWDGLKLVWRFTPAKQEAQ